MIAIKEKIREIDIALDNIIFKELKSNESHLGLFSGLSGISLLYANNIYLNSGTKNLDKLSELFTYSIQKINKNTGFLQGTYSMGIEGFGWLLNYLTQKHLLEDSYTDALEAIDLIAYENAKFNFNNSNFDFLHGSIGDMFYLSERLTNKKVHKYLSPLISNLIDNVQKSDYGLFWYDDYNIENKKIEKKGIINLGLAHGHASKISLLSKIASSSLSSPEIIKILEETINFLLSFENHNNQPFLFPSYIKNNVPEYKSRLSWCYGDLGIASAIWQAGKALKNEIWKQKAINIAISSTKCQDLKMNGVVDVCLCHGTAGIAHIFNRFYKETGIKEFDSARWYWLEQTLLMDKWFDGLAGYKTYITNEKWQNEYGLLGGVAGVSIVLQGFLSDNIENLSWDRCLLLS